MGVSGATSKLWKAAKKMVMAACGSCSSTTSHLPSPSARGTGATSKQSNCSLPQGECKEKTDCSGLTALTSKNLCPICLEALSHSAGYSPGQAIFTGQCSHSFHFSCIASNVRHGSATCPVCRAQWTHLPRGFKKPPASLSGHRNDPVFRILDDSIATFRVNRRYSLRSACYNDDDPIDTHNSTNYPCLDFSLEPIPRSSAPYTCCFRQSHLDEYSKLQMDRARLDYNHLTSPSSSAALSSFVLSPPEEAHCFCTALCNRTAFLSVKLENPNPMDLVLVVSPNGPHLRLLKQSMALVVFSLRPVDRLAIVTNASATARVFPLRCMTSCGKRTALQVIDRLFYMGQTDPSEGLRKGIKILEDRAYKNPWCTILHLSDNPANPYYPEAMGQMCVVVHRFHVRFGVGNSNGFAMREFEEFLGKMLGGVVNDIQLRIGEEAKIVKIGELRGGEERRILLELGEHVDVRVGYSYVEWGSEECIRRRGETVVSFNDEEVTKTDDRGAARGTDEHCMSFICARSSISTEAWDYHDPFLARRWAKRLHGYKL